MSKWVHPSREQVLKTKQDRERENLWSILNRVGGGAWSKWSPPWAIPGEKFGVLHGPWIQHCRGLPVALMKILENVTWRPLAEPTKRLEDTHGSVGSIEVAWCPILSWEGSSAHFALGINFSIFRVNFKTPWMRYPRLLPGYDKDHLLSTSIMLSVFFTKFNLCNNPKGGYHCSHFKDENRRLIKLSNYYTIDQRFQIHDYMTVNFHAINQ